MQACNGKAGDLNESDEVVVLGNPIPCPVLKFRLDGVKPATFTQVEGTLDRSRGTSMEATFFSRRGVKSGDDDPQIEVGYQETADEKIYKLRPDVQKGSPGEITVRQRKGETGFTIEQEFDSEGFPIKHRSSHGGPAADLIRCKIV